MIRAMSSAEATDPDESMAVSATLKLARTRLGLSVAALAEKSGVSMGQISQLERGRANPSLRTLTKLARAVGVPLTQLLSGARPTKVTFVAAGAGIDLPHHENSPGYRRELLTPSWLTDLQVIRTELPSGYSNEGLAYRHLGYESVTVLSGRLRVVVGSDAFVLQTGDTVSYECSEPHWWVNENRGTTVVLGSVIPVSS